MQITLRKQNGIGQPVPDIKPFGHAGSMGALIAWPNHSPPRAGRLPKFQKVSDDLYRSAQPTAEGLRYLEDIGIRTVVNLRAFHSDAETIKDTGLAYKQIRVKGYYPERTQVIKFLGLLADSRKVPVLVHCQYGIHRTGLMCMAYRMVTQGWTKEEALEEIAENGFGAYRIREIHQWIRRMDMEGVQEKLAMATPLSFLRESLLWRRFSLPLREAANELT